MENASDNKAPAPESLFGLGVSHPQRIFGCQIELVEVSFLYLVLSFLSSSVSLSNVGGNGTVLISNSFSQMCPTGALQVLSPTKGCFSQNRGPQFGVWTTQCISFLCQPHSFAEKEDFHKPGNPNIPDFQRAVDAWVTHEPRKKDQKMRNRSNWSRYFKFLLYKSTKGFATIANQV